MTNDELTAIEERAAAATPGPWVNMGNDSDDGGPWFGELRADYGFTLIAKMPELDDKTNDFEFMAAARTDIPTLCAEVRRLQEEGERLLNAVKSLGGGLDEYWITTDEGRVIMSTVQATIAQAGHAHDVGLPGLPPRD